MCPPQTHSVWPLRDAWCSKVKPWLLVAVTSMPGTSVRTSTMPVAPVPAEMAQCRGVLAWASCQWWASGHLVAGLLDPRDGTRGPSTHWQVDITA